ncbi:glycerophosphodiester phosphodiesterase family protein [Halomonas cerina]|uniref:Glycerophosphoryl diester phosphodiesterase n=1 Tax=Halomonas cerina TaxID=447424 RepID=A0A839V8W1_9GAMM|nr:glycerophosphodiester phosphodiesterase family protein [Halomonas cerina]MBB3188996.1 glycerophosphoryl diester phosphodiesterase [Halomonas cerina]
MLALSQLGGDVLRSLRDHLRPLIAYHLFFTLLASSLLLPTAGWTLAYLLGRVGGPVITNAELIDTLVSPGGMLWLLAALGLAFLVLYLQQAGMTLVAVRPRDHHVRLAFEALWACLRRLPSLASLVVLQVGSQLLLALPTLLAVLALHDGLLGHLDPYYVQQVRPPVLWGFFAVALPVVLGWALVAALLYTRWHLALPILILEGVSARRALRRSQHLTRGRGRHIALSILVLLAGILLLPLLATLVFDSLFTPLLHRLPERDAILVPAMLGYVSAYLLLTLAITFIGIAANALMATCLYLRLAHRQPRPPAPPPGAHPGRLAWIVELAVLLFAIGQAWLIINRFELHEDVAIIAHRGSSLAAPENTLAAVEQAIAEGADLIEVDVRLTADEAVVLYHDATLARLAGDPRRLDALDRETLATVDVGSWFGDAYVGERIPGLDETLARIRGRAALMIELKPTPGDGTVLVRRVLEVLAEEVRWRRACRHRAPDRIQAAACGDPQVLRRMGLATLSYRLLREIKRQAPEARTILLAQLVMRGTLPRRGFDALALRHNRIDEDEIRRARHYGYALYAWTINDPTRMSQLIDLGIDGIITDRPARLAALLAERRRLGDGALMLVKLRNWLRD